MIFQFDGNVRIRFLMISLFSFRSLQFQIEYLNYDGCPIADLGLYFTLPGHANIELRRGGRDISVTIQNLHLYVQLVTYWFLVEGVQMQFEALREGKHHWFSIYSFFGWVVEGDPSIR